jgi:16S rRNA (cytidine1402-2'-O)-methyltransferase
MKPKHSSVGAKPPKTKNHSRPNPTDTEAASKPSVDTAFPGLFVAATPIGNASDITLRALKILDAADVIACEDTRVTARLLSIHGISTSMVPYHEHNAEKLRPVLINRLKSGDTVALVSDAGTPLVSDPGYKLVRACVEEGIPVTALPGPSAVLTALVLSGLPSDRFLFAGFPPPRRAGRRKVFAELASVPATLVFLESPRRLPASLVDMAETFGPREASVSREMTKMFEETRRGNLADLAAFYGESGPPRGEVTVVVAPPGPAGPPAAEDVDRLLLDALVESSLRDATDRTVALTGLPRREVYARALELARKKP